MIERIEDMAEGTIGFRARGEIGAEGYKSVLEPPSQRRYRSWS